MNEKKKSDDDENVEESQESEEPESSIVHVAIVQRISESYSSGRRLFGTPYILSVSRNITYKELYKAIVLRMAGDPENGVDGVLREIPPLDIKTDLGMFGFLHIFK